MSPGTAIILGLASVLWRPALAQEAARPRDVGFVATPVALVTGMLDLAAVADTDVVYDLGSGDGRIVIAAARRGARSVGVELDSMLVEESRASADSAGVSPRVEFRRADLFATDLRPATVVTLYLGRELNQRLRPILSPRPSPRHASRITGLRHGGLDAGQRDHGPESRGGCHTDSSVGDPGRRRGPVGARDRTR
jgi:hypothetical protein